MTEWYYCMSKLGPNLIWKTKSFIKLQHFIINNKLLTIYFTVDRTFQIHCWETEEKCQKKPGDCCPEWTHSSPMSGTLPCKSSDIFLITVQSIGPRKKSSC